jgi:hypothetical protein
MIPASAPGLPPKLAADVELANLPVKFEGRFVLFKNRVLADLLPALAQVQFLS